MVEYIKREDAINLLWLFADESCASVVSDFESLPAADVAEVVRCRDCKWFNHYTMECESDDVATDHEGGASFSINFGPDDFCSYGQRKLETVLPKSDAKDESLEADHEI